MDFPLSDLPEGQRLALAYAPRRARSATMVVLALDARLATILRKRREVVLAQVRLAWWREMLARPRAEWPAGDPVLDALAQWTDCRGLVPLVDGWEALLADDLTPGAIHTFIDGRAAAFVALAEELGVANGHAVAGSARIWAAADLAAHLSDQAERRMVIDVGLTLPRSARLSRQMAPLAVLAALGRDALRRDGAALLDGPKSALLALRTGLFGR